MSLRTGGLLLFTLVCGLTFWFAMSTGWYPWLGLGRAHLTLSLLAVACFCCSWILDEQRKSRY